MTLLRLGVLACALSPLLSAGNVTADAFAYQFNGLGTSLGLNVTAVSNLVLPITGGSLSFAIGTNLTDISSPGGKTLFSFDGPLSMWLSDFNYSCNTSSNPCGLDLDITGSFDVLSASPFTTFQASGAGSFSGPDGSMLTLDYSLGGAYSAQGQQQFISPPPTFSFQDSGALISNSTFLVSIVDFTLGIHSAGSGGVGNGTIGIIPIGPGIGNGTIGIVPVGPSIIGNINLPGKAAFNLAVTTPEPGPALLLSAVMLLGLAARSISRRRKSAPRA
jgi:hypothetical protein